MVRKKRTELGKPSPTPSHEGMRETSSYKETKSEIVGRVADETVVLLMSCKSRTEGRVSAELRHPKNGRGVYYPARDYPAHKASGCLVDVAQRHVVLRFRKAV